MTRDVRDVYCTAPELLNDGRRRRLAAHGFEVTGMRGSPLVRWQNFDREIAVIESHELHGRARDSAILIRWHHLSVSKRDRSVPAWDVMSEMKELFMGDDVEAYLVHPPRTRYVNFHPGVLHWYACVELPDGILPDFRVLGTVDPFDRRSKVGI